MRRWTDIRSNRNYQDYRASKLSSELRLLERAGSSLTTEPKR